MAVITAQEIGTPISSGISGADHQVVKGPGASISSSGPVPVGAALQGGVTGIAYSETISANGGTSPYSYAVTSGSLPGGLSLNSTTGVIDGTPSATGTSSFTITVTDAHGATGSQGFEISIVAPSSGSGGSYPFIG